MQPNNQPRAAQTPAAAQGPGAPRAGQTLPPLHTFRAESPPDEDPSVDCWLDPNGKWDTKSEYLCASRTDLNARVDLEDSY